MCDERLDWQSIELRFSRLVLLRRSWRVSLGIRWLFENKQADCWQQQQEIQSPWRRRIDGRCAEGCGAIEEEVNKASGGRVRDEQSKSLLYYRPQQNAQLWNVVSSNPWSES